MRKTFVNAALCSALVVGLGLSESRAQSEPVLGENYYALENLETGVVARGTTEALGTAFSQLILTANTQYRIWILSPLDLRIARVDIESGPPGSSFTLPDFVLRPHSSFDVDGDGLSDVAEFIVGTDVEVADTDGDGLVDGAEILGGGNPLDGQPLALGIVQTLATDSPASELEVDGSLLVVAHELGLTGYSIFTGLPPLLVASVPLPTPPLRVSSDERQVAVALGDQGVAVFDLSDPSQVSTVFSGLPTELVAATGTPGEVTCVLSAAEFVYAGLSSGWIAVVDLSSGVVLRSIDLGSPVRGLARSGDFLYAATSSRLHRLRSDPFILSELESVASSVSVGFVNLAAGSEIAYPVHARGYNPYSIDGLGLGLLFSGFSVTGWRDIAIDGAGLGLAVVGSDLNVYAVPGTDPGLSSQFVDTLETPGSARAVTIANGRAYIADDASGVHVVKYTFDDTFGIPPAISLDTSFGFEEIEEGARARITALVSDDVSVRSVVFTLDGVMTTDATYPFELFFVAPVAADSPQVSFSARVFDTGGNSTQTETFIVSVVPDSSPPEVIEFLPTGTLIGVPGQIACLFSERLDPASVDPSALVVAELGPDRIASTGDDFDIVPSAVTLTTEGRVVAFQSAGFIPGYYEAQLSDAITDLAGNGLAGQRSWRFFIYENPDLDGDGELDGFGDPDGDGLITAYELLLGLDPLVADYDPELDTDGDGLSDGEEFALGLVPTIADFDGDGLLDGEEVEDGSDPFDPTSIPLTSAFAEGTVENNALLPNHAFSVGSVSNEALLPSSAHGTASVRNETAPSAVLGEVTSGTVSVENQTP